MIGEYLRELDELISASPHIIDVEVIRRSVWDTELEKVALYRYRLKMSNGGLLELTERLVEEERKRGRYRVCTFSKIYYNLLRRCKAFPLSSLW